jgi:LDH2 family malate/lactate/ureidoglycolate dehydrogenase
MIEILSSTLSGAAWGPQVRSPYEDWHAPTNSGLWCLAVDLAPLVPQDEYSNRLGDLLDQAYAGSWGGDSPPICPGSGCNCPDLEVPGK